MMLIKRISAIFLTLSMMLAFTPATKASQNVLSSVDFSLQNVGDKPDGWEIYGVPESGNVSITKGDTEDTKYLTIEDTAGDAGPSVSYKFSSLMGTKTINAKFRASQMCAIEFSAGDTSSFAKGFRLNVASDLHIWLETERGVVYDNPIPQYRVTPNTWIEIWLCIDTRRGLANLFIQIDALKTYKGSVSEKSILNDNVLVMKNIPMNVESLGLLRFGTTKSTGITLLEYVKIYSGMQSPVEIKNEPEKTIQKFNVKYPMKAPWLSRMDTINALLTGTIPGASDRFSADVKHPVVEKPDISEFMPDRNKVIEILNSKKGVRPKLFLEKEEWNTLKEKIKTKEYEKLYKLVEDAADKAIKGPLYDITTDKVVEENQRTVGDNIATFSFMYKLTEEKKYLDAAQQWAKIACELPKFGNNNDDLAAGHILLGLGVMYDWLYNDMDASVKNQVYSILVERGEIMRSVLTTKYKYWASEYLQNHGWINLGGMLAAGLAIYDEYEEAINWIMGAAEFYATTFTLSGSDGAGHEGVGYWAYGTGALLRYAKLSEQFLGLDVYKSEWLKNTGNYRLFISLPRNGWSNQYHTANFADAHGYDYRGPNHILYHLASRYNLPHVQWLADELLNSGCANDPSTAWENLIYYNPEIKPIAPTNLPTLNYLDDLGIVTSRSGWDGDESAIYFKCGAVVGKEATRFMQAYNHSDLGSGHSHPDTNSFILFGGGESLLRDDGYVKKTTESHNTLLVNGEGQIGEGDTWFNGGMNLEISYYTPSIKKVFSSDEYDYFVGAGANAYPVKSGLKKYNRHMIFIKPNTLIVVDDIELNKEAALELRFFPEQQNISPIGNGAMVQGVKTDMFIDNLTPDEGKLNVEPLDIIADINGGKTKRNAITVNNNSDKWLNATAITWSEKGNTPQKVSLEKKDGELKFSVGDKLYTLKTKTNYVSVEKNNGSVVKEPQLYGVLVNGYPIGDIEEGVFNYKFDLDKYPRNVRTSSGINIIAIPSENGVKVVTEKPESLPGAVKITVSNGDKTNTYTVDVLSTVVNVERLQLKTVDNTNKISPGNPPSLALDNDLSTYWATEGDGSYVDYDLGSVRNVDGVDLSFYKGGERINYFDIEVSQDGKTFTKVFEGQSSGITSDPEYFSFDNTASARYIRIVGHGNSQGHFWFSVNEFGAYVNK